MSRNEDLPIQWVLACARETHATDSAHHSHHFRADQFVGQTQLVVAHGFNARVGLERGKQIVAARKVLLRLPLSAINRYQRKNKQHNSLTVLSEGGKPCH